MSDSETRIEAAAEALMNARPFAFCYRYKAEEIARIVLAAADEVQTETARAELERLRARLVALANNFSSESMGTTSGWWRERVQEIAAGFGFGGNRQVIRVAYIGNFKHPHCTEVAVAWALEQLGCYVHRIQQEEAQRIRNTSLLSMDTLLSSDLVLYTRTHNQTALGPEWNDAWQTLAGWDVVTASLHLDRFWDLEREKLIHDGDPLFTTQHVFTADGGNDARWADAGVNHHWMPPAIDERELGPWQQDPMLAYPVVFVGSSQYHAEYPERRDLLDFLHRRYKDQFRIFGPPRNVIRGEKLRTLYASAKCIVGDSCFANQGDGSKARNYWSDRVPEVMGRGGNLLHPIQPALLDYPCALYDPGDWDFLARLIDVMLLSDQHETRMASIAHAREHNTWTVRMREILETVGLSETALGEST